MNDKRIRIPALICSMVSLATSLAAGLTRGAAPTPAERLPGAANPTRLASLTLAASLTLGTATALAQGPPTADPSAVGLSAERLGRVDALIEGAIADDQIAGAVALIARDGRVAHLSAYGMADIDDGETMQTDTIFRFASMTKPITSLAVMMLYEEGHFLLNEPVSRFIPELANPSMLSTKGSGIVPAGSEISIHDLLTHTSGLSYGFLAQGAGPAELARRYVEAGVSDGLVQTDGVIADLPGRLSQAPLLFEPGTQYAYSLSIDVLGRLVEVVSGMTLAEFFETRIFEPLGMDDTAFFIDAETAAERLASVYTTGEDGSLVETGPEPIELGTLRYSASFHYDGPQTYFSGGAGLVSTASDYARFLQLMLNGGALDGERLVSPKTVEFMTRNQIGDLDVSPGVKFGLGFAVIEDPGQVGETQSAGNYYWGGFFNTSFFVDPGERMFAILLTQRFPGDQTNVRDKFVSAVYQALIE